MKMEAEVEVMLLQGKERQEPPNIGRAFGVSLVLPSFTSDS